MSGTYLSVASWEPRFVLGVTESLNSGAFDRLFIIYSARSGSKTRASRQKLAELCKSSGTTYIEKELDFDNQVSVVLGLMAIFPEVSEGGCDIVFDLSTSPRDIILFILSNAAKVREKISVVYYPAEKYSPWLARETGIPRMIIGSSGIMYPDKQTCVIALCANEISRIEQVYYHLEPSKIVLLSDKDRSKYGEIESLSTNMMSISSFVEFDHKDISKENMRFIFEIADRNREYNTVMISTGPKIGVLHIFATIMHNEEIGAAYIPSMYYNDE